MKRAVETVAHHRAIPWLAAVAIGGLLGAALELLSRPQGMCTNDLRSLGQAILMLLTVIAAMVVVISSLVVAFAAGPQSRLRRSALLLSVAVAAVPIAFIISGALGAGPCIETPEPGVAATVEVTLEQPVVAHLQASGRCVPASGHAAPQVIATHEPGEAEGILFVMIVVENAEVEPRVELVVDSVRGSAHYYGPAELAAPNRVRFVNLPLSQPDGQSPGLGTTAGGEIAWTCSGET